MESRFSKDLRLLVDKTLNMSQQCAKETNVLTEVRGKVNSILSCIRITVASRSMKVILSLYSALVTHLWGILGSPVQRKLTRVSLVKGNEYDERFGAYILYRKPESTRIV